MTSKRPVASFLFFLAALWSIDVVFCSGSEATPGAREELPGHPVGGPAPQTEGVIPDISAGDKHQSNSEENAQLADEFVDDDSESRREDERPRTTKRLYTTKGSVRAATRNSSLTKAKLLSLAAVLLVSTLVVAFKGTLWAPEEDEESEEEDPQQAENN